MAPYLAAFFVYGFLCTLLVRALGWPWWSTVPMALLGVAALALLARQWRRRDV